MIKKERFFAVQRVLKFVALLALAMPLALASCSSSSDSDDEEELGEDYDPDAYRLAKNVCNVANDVAEIYMDCNSIEELKEYAGDIKKMRNVEDVYFTNTTMFVKVRDYGPIMFGFFPKEEPFNPDDLMYKTVRTRVAHPSLNLKTAVVVDQAFNDEGRPRARYMQQVVLDLFRNHDIEAVPRNDAGLSFYEKDIFDYDIIYIMTHGGHDPETDTHWLYTSETPTDQFLTDHNITTLDPQYFYPFKDLPNVKLSMLKETRNNKEVGIWYFAISDDYIANASFSFENPSVVFVCACQSMKGPGIDIQKGVPQDTISRRLSNAFISRNAGLYLGFDESNSIGDEIGFYYFQRLLSGMSYKNSYEDLPFWCRHEYQTDTDEDAEGNVISRNYWADLIIHYRSSEDTSIKKPQLRKWEDLSTSDEIKVILKAKSIFDFQKVKWNQDNGIYYSDPDNDKKDFKYGFIISDNEGFGNSKILKRMNVGDPGCKINAKKEVEFELTLTKDDLKPSTTYYYMAFFVDGYDNYFSDPDSFTTKDLPVDTGTQLPDVPGTDF